MSIGFLQEVRLVLAVALVCLSAGCGPGREPIPAGAQQVHVTVEGSDVRLEPATATAGDIYVVMVTPGSSVGFAQRMSSAAERPGPLTEEDLRRLARGDTQGTAIGGFDDLGCSPEQRAESRGQMGPCGNVFRIALDPGKYAFFTGSIEREPGSVSPSITVLEVVP